MVDRITDIWGERTPHPRGTVWPARVDLHLDEGVAEADVERWVQSACLLCSNGCGCDIAVKDGRMVGVRGRGGDVVNHGRLGPKGLYGSTPWASSPDRLTRPLVRRDGVLVETDWQTAMGTVVEVSKRLLEEKAPLSLGFYTSGQLFIEEYYALAVSAKAAWEHLTWTATRGCARPRLRHRSRRASAPTGNRARTPTSSTVTRSSCSATTWPRRRPSCGPGSWTGRVVRTRRPSSASTHAAHVSPTRQSARGASTSRPRL